MSTAEKPRPVEGIVGRLRRHALPDPHDKRNVLHAPLLSEAADEIERLQDELKHAWRRGMVDSRISYRGFSYGMGAQWGIDSLRNAIERDGNG